MDPVSTPAEHQYTLDDLEHHVVAATLHDTQLLEYCVVHFAGRLSGRLGSLFGAARAYFDVARGNLTREALASILQTNEPNVEKHQDYLALFDALSGPPYSTQSESDRRWFFHQYDVEWRITETGNALANAATAMRNGHVAHGRQYSGADAAWQLLAEAAVDYRASTDGHGNAEAELTTSTDAAKQDYIKATQTDWIGTPLALPEVNSALYGLRPGDLFIVASYAHEGKSFIQLNDAHASWKEGKNVAFASGEMGVPKCRARFVALHSCEHKFPYPLETKKIERGILSKEEHEVMLQVLEDIKTNPAYGKFFMFKFQRRSTPTMIFNKLAGYDQIVPLDFACLDYLGLMASDRPRVTRREELDDLIRDVKAFALDFGGGRGIAIEAGYQTNRQSYAEALREGYYTLSCFSESSEAEKSADAAQYILKLPQNPEELKSAIIKNRDDELTEAFFIKKNLKHAKLSSMQSSRSTPTTGATTSVLDI